jgi:hypothetical protein
MDTIEKDIPPCPGDIADYVWDAKIKKWKLLAAVAIGSRKSEAKAAAARENSPFIKGHKMGFQKGHTLAEGKKPIPLFDSPCNCGAGDVIEGHKSKCPRYHLIFKRRKNHLDLMTGKPLESPSQVAA